MVWNNRSGLLVESKGPSPSKSLIACISKELSQFHFDFFQTSLVLLKMEAASTFAGTTHRRKLCVPALLAINFMKMESPANLQVKF